MPILSNFPGGSGSGGGGLTLAAVSNIKTLVASGKVYVSWTDPADLVVSDSTLATWGGTLLVRKAGSAPSSRRDGTIVLDSRTRDAYSDSYFCDSGLTDGVTYYYKFFSYTTANAYTDSTDNEFNATPTAQVTGIDTWNVTSMSASSEAGDGKMTVKWTDPAATIASDGVTLATWASTTIVVKAGDYAVSKEDADAAYTLKVTTRNQYSGTALTITGLTNGTTYYISFFPETTDGGINASTLQRTTGTANRITIDNVPTQSGTLTYNGSEQTPSWDNYNTTYMTIGGTSKGINAGEYTATFTPNTDYRWSDGTVTAKEATWLIEKAAGSLSLSTTTVTLKTDNPTETVTVTRAGDGVITATSSNANVATVSVSDTTLTISHGDNLTGSAIITVKVAAGTNHTAAEDGTITVTAQFISTTLDDVDWSTISSVAADGKASNYWEVGDCKSITLNGTVGTLSLNETYYVYILGFNHGNSSKTIDFGTFKTADGVDVCLTDSHYGAASNGSPWFSMNYSQLNTNAGGWGECELRSNIMGSDREPNYPLTNTLMSALPSDLRAVMKPMTVYTDNVGGGEDNASASNVSGTTDYLPLLAEHEVFGSQSADSPEANPAEQDYQEQYAYYAAGNSKKKYPHDSTAAFAVWWLRSPTYDYSSKFCIVNSGGSNGSNASMRSYGLAPIFRV